MKVLTNTTPLPSQQYYYLGNPPTTTAHMGCCMQTTWVVRIIPPHLGGPCPQGQHLKIPLKRVKKWQMSGLNIKVAIVDQYRVYAPRPKPHIPLCKGANKERFQSDIGLSNYAFSRQFGKSFKPRKATRFIFCKCWKSSEEGTFSFLVFLQGLGEVSLTVIGLLEDCDL